MYGVALAMEASKRGLKNVVIEKKDFGWATTYNHLRTLHGGLRYLQNLDLPAFLSPCGNGTGFYGTFPAWCGRCPA